MAEFWGKVDEDEPIGYIWSAIRGIFDIALLSIVAVFLLQHDSHESELATVLAKAIAATCAASAVLSGIEFLAFPIPFEDPGIAPVLLHLLFAGGRLAIVMLGLVPRNTLRLIWVQYKRDDHGGVIIALTAVSWTLDVLYLLLAGSLTFTILCCPCWTCWDCACVSPIRNIKKRAKKNREVAGSVRWNVKGDVEAASTRGGSTIRG